MSQPTKKQMRAAVAEVCGWKRKTVIVDTGWLVTVEEEKAGWESTTGRIVVGDENLPNYLNDLNAMHEAEKAMTDKQRYQYTRCLSQVCQTGATHLDVFATAAQRAEAFLRTVRPDFFATP